MPSAHVQCSYMYVYMQFTSYERTSSFPSYELFVVSALLGWSNCLIARCYAVAGVIRALWVLRKAEKRYINVMNYYYYYYYYLSDWCCVAMQLLGWSEWLMVRCYAVAEVIRVLDNKLLCSYWGDLSSWWCVAMQFLGLSKCLIVRCYAVAWMI